MHNTYCAYRFAGEVGQSRKEYLLLMGPREIEKGLAMWQGTCWLEILTASMFQPERVNEGNSEVFKAEQLAPVSMRLDECLLLIRQYK